MPIQNALLTRVGQETIVTSVNAFVATDVTITCVARSLPVKQENVTN